MIPMNISYIVKRASQTAKSHGFVTETRRPIADHVALLHSEVTEIYEAHRDGHSPVEHLYEGQTGVSQERNDQTPKPIGIPSELADVVIRAAQFAGEYGIDLERAIEEKLEYNEFRPFMHGRKL